MKRDGTQRKSIHWGLISFGLLMILLGSGIVIAQLTAMGILVGGCLVLLGGLCTYGAITPDDLIPKDGNALECTTGNLDTIQYASEAHRDDLKHLPRSDRRMAILLIWRRAIEEDAHDFSDLISSHKQRDSLIEIKIDAITEAYLTGYIAGRNWIAEDIARQHACIIGHGLRNRLRKAGIKFDTLNPSLGVVIDSILEKITEQGIADSRE